RVCVELASLDALGQGVLNQTGDASHQIRKGLARVLVQPLAFDRAQFHQSPRRGTSAGRRAGTEVFYGQIEERRKALPQRPRAECLLQQDKIFARIALVGGKKQRFLAAKSIVETAALNARVTGDVRERRSTHPFAPELIEGNAQDVVVVK